jgi:hypothetical protein
VAQPAARFGATGLVESCNARVLYSLAKSIASLNVLFILVADFLASSVHLLIREIRKPAHPGCSRRQVFPKAAKAARRIRQPA